MHKEKRIGIAVISGISASIFLIFLLSSLFSFIYNPSRYEPLLSRHGVYNRFEKEEALSAVDNIIGYFKHGESLDRDFFSQGEMMHLEDVKGLISKAQIVYYSAIAFFSFSLAFLYVRMRKRFASVFASSLMYSSIVVVSIIIIAAGLYLIVGFDRLFLLFHTTFFEGNYAFDPRISNMKALFPDMFFLDASAIILREILFKAGLLFGAGVLIRKKTR